MKTTQEMIEVMQAHVRGEEIEFHDIADDDWRKVPGVPVWAWHNTDYRIKPKAREFLITLRSDGTTEVVIAPGHVWGSDTIRVREICGSN